MPMSAAEITAYLHRYIPLAKHMGLRVVHWDGLEMRLGAPLKLNSNHEGAGFGGSIATLGIVAGWAYVHARLGDEGLEAKRLVVQRSETIYTRPIAGDLVAICRDDGKATWRKFARSVAQRGRGRIHLRMEMISAEEEGAGQAAAVQEGVYVVTNSSAP